MSRFTFCNCPAGFNADPERHAPDCPGRSGAGKARTPVPATIKPAEQHHGDPVARTQFDYDRGFTAGSAECETLRAQLAEQHALLTTMKELFRVDDPFDLYDAVCAAISANAEMSALEVATNDFSSDMDDLRADILASTLEENARLANELAERDALLRKIANACSCPATQAALDELTGSAEPSAPKCEACQGNGVIGWRRGQTAESYEEGESTCEGCGGTGLSVLVERDGWVSVTERKPEYDKVVLVAFDNHEGKNYTTAHLTNQKRCADPRSTEHDEVWYVHVSGGHRLKAVTHWCEIDRASLECKP